MVIPFITLRLGLDALAIDAPQYVMCKSEQLTLVKEYNSAEGNNYQELDEKIYSMTTITLM